MNPGRNIRIFSVAVSVRRAHLPHFISRAEFLAHVLASHRLRRLWPAKKYRRK